MRGKRGRQEEEVKTEKILDVDASMQGTMVFKDPVNLRINGKFDGRLKTRGQLTIGKAAEVTADIDAESITIAGSVKGNVIATKEIILISPARMVGDVTAPSLQVEAGAFLNGQCRMENAGVRRSGAGSFMSVDELARYLEVDSGSISQWAQGGKIPAVKEGDSWKFDRSTIDEWVAAQRK